MVKQRAKSKEQRAKSKEQRAKSKEQRAKTKELKVNSESRSFAIIYKKCVFLRMKHNLD